MNKQSKFEKIVNENVKAGNWLCDCATQLVEDLEGQFIGALAAESKRHLKMAIKSYTKTAQVIKQSKTPTT